MAAVEETLPATLVDPDLPTTQTSCKLISLDPDIDDISFDPGDEFSMGRNSSCSITLKNPYVSQNHFKLYSSAAGDIYVHDLSCNGTWVGQMSSLQKIGQGNRKKICDGDFLTCLDQANIANKGKLLFRLEQPRLAQEKNSKWGAISKHYVIGDQLGKGSFASVHAATHIKTGAHFAVKIMDKKKLTLVNDFCVSKLLEEVNLLQRVSHKNVAKIKDVYNDDDFLCIILELIRGGDMLDYVVNSRKFTEAEAKIMFIQLVEALLYLHSQDVVHRDLKPENILIGTKPGFVVPQPVPGQAGFGKKEIPVDQLVLILSDFGLAKYIGDTNTMMTMCGTPVYIAPEVQRGGGYTRDVDTWSIGIILYILLTGHQPKNADAGKTKFPDKYWGGISTDAKDLTDKLLQVKPVFRINLAGVVKHPWLVNEHIEGRERADEICKTKQKPGDGAITNVLKRVKGQEVVGTIPKKKILWCWKANIDASDSDETAWKAYTDSECEQIENGYQRHLEKLQNTVRVNGSYKIDLNQMFQWNLKEPTKQRDVKRMVV